MDEEMCKSPIAKELGMFTSNRRSDTEYSRTLEVSKAPDLFPCHHVLCHHCVRKNLTRSGFGATLHCPICGVTVDYDIPDFGTAVGYDDNCNAMLVTNFDEIVSKFNGIGHQIRRIKREEVETSTMGMTYTGIHCDNCDGSHGTLKVLQELNNLSVTHKRPDNLNGYFYRLSMGEVVTSFYSKVNSACICVPCTYKGLLKSNKFPKLKSPEDLADDIETQTSLAEVGKLIVQKRAPVIYMEGKNMIEVDHKISIKNRADDFDFNYNAKRIEKMIRQQEESLIRIASRQIRDNGKLFYVRENNNIECEDLVLGGVNRQRMQSDIW